MFLLAVVLVALVAPSQQGSTYKLLKKYGEQKLEEACYGYEAQRIWKYHCHEAEKKCKDMGYKVSGHDYLPFMPAHRNENPFEGYANKPAMSPYGQYQPVIFGRPQPGPTSTVTLYPNTQYYPYSQQQQQQQVSPSNNLANFLQSMSIRRFQPTVPVRVPSYDHSQKKYFERSEPQHYPQQYPSTSGFKTAAFKTPVDHSVRSPTDYYKSQQTGVRSPTDYYKSQQTGGLKYYTMSPTAVYPPSIYSSPQARRFKREAVHMSKPTKAQLDEFEKNVLEEQRDEKESEIMGMKCIMQEMGYLMENDKIDLKYSKDEISALEIEDELKQNLLDVMDGCYEMSQNLPDQILKQFPVTGELARSMYYFKCNDKMSKKVCLKHELAHKVPMSRKLVSKDKKKNKKN